MRGTSTSCPCLGRLLPRSPRYPSGLFVEQDQNSILVLMRVITSDTHRVLLGARRKAA